MILHPSGSYKSVYCMRENNFGEIALHQAGSQ